MDGLLFKAEPIVKKDGNLVDWKQLLQAENLGEIEWTCEVHKDIVDAGIPVYVIFKEHEGLFATGETRSQVRNLAVDTSKGWLIGSEPEVIETIPKVRVSLRVSKVPESDLEVAGLSDILGRKIQGAVTKLSAEKVAKLEQAIQGI